MTSTTPKNIARFHKRLQRWYRDYGRRDLPWRNTRDPYAIYISEIMLQQTQVKTVLERYYFPFLARFPTLQSVADAPVEDVLKRWEGLGYYSRARNLHKAAIQCNAVLPSAEGDLLQLPGIGKNTAHAIAAFAHHRPVAVMEANLRRVLARVYALDNVSRETLLWEKADALLDRHNPFDYNQAMMDLGAMICTKRAPKCSECPANELCTGKDDPQRYPAQKQKKPVPVRKKTIVVFAAHPHPLGPQASPPSPLRERVKNSPLSLQGEGWGEGVVKTEAIKYHIVSRETSFLGGLWGFLEIDVGEKSATLYGQMYPLRKGKKLGAITQTYSHFRLEAQVWLLPVVIPESSSTIIPESSSTVIPALSPTVIPEDSSPVIPAQAGIHTEHWKTLKDIKELPLSKADWKVMRLLEEEE